MKNRTFAMMALLALLTIVAVPGFAQTVWTETDISKDCPMPSGINRAPRITPPDPNLPPEIAAFSGRWEGIWPRTSSEPSMLNGTKMVLVVERIDAKNARVIYSWYSDQTYISYGVWAAGSYERCKAKIVMEGGRYSVKFGITSMLRTDVRVSYSPPVVRVSNFTFTFDPSSLTLKGTGVTGPSKATVTLHKISMD